MNLNVSKRADGRVYLAIVKTYQNGETGRHTNKTVKSLGYVDELESEFPDPISHFREVARQMTDEENERRYRSFSFDLDEALPEMDVNAPGTRNLGYAVPLKIFHELNLHKFLKKKARGEHFEFNTASIMILLVISRILSPGSKLKAFNEKSRYFERFDFTTDDVYRSLTHFNKISLEMQRYMHEMVKAKYGSDTGVVYFDVTNYYFEISTPDEIRKYGKPKQNRKKPVIQMGLAMDKDGIPLHYELFPGNKLDKETFRSVIGEVRKTYDTGRIIVVADMGIITGDNIWYVVGGKPEKPQNGYVFSFSVRGGSDSFKKYVLDDNGYVGKDGKPATDDSDFKIKSEVKARTIKVTMADGTKKDRTVYEKKVVFWSRKYAVKARAERAEILAKAMDMIEDPKKYNKATSYGAAAYIGNIDYDKDTGEVISKTGKVLELKSDKIEAEELFDGYYSIVTSELNMSDYEIIDTYRGLWEIEETFKITKSDLAARPVYVYDPDHINAHFLTCFIALTILRIIQKVTKKMFSAATIVDSLNKIVCMNESENIYLFGFRNKITDALGKAFDVDFTKKRLRLADIKKIIADTKK
jgi:transposase